MSHDFTTMTPAAQAVADQAERLAPFSVDGGLLLTLAAELRAAHRTMNALTYALDGSTRRHFERGEYVDELQGELWRKERKVRNIEAEATKLVNAAEAERDAAYRGRAELIAVLAKAHDGAAVIVEGSDPDAPGWPIIYIETWAGQLSWHLSPHDMDLFEGLDIPHLTEEPGRWDGHDDAEKSRRLAAMTLHTRAR